MPDMSNRPEAGATNPKTAPVPPPSAQPGVLGPATPTASTTPVAKRPASRIGERIEAQRALSD